MYLGRFCLAFFVAVTAVSCVFDEVDQLSVKSDEHYSVGGGSPADVISDVMRNPSDPFFSQLYRSIPLLLNFNFFDSSYNPIAASDALIVSLRDGHTNQLVSRHSLPPGSTTLNTTVLVQDNWGSIELDLQGYAFQTRVIDIPGIDQIASINRDLYVLGAASIPSYTDLDSDGIQEEYDADDGDPSIAFHVNYPHTGYFTLAYEDSYPATGDRDYNDFVAEYKVKEMKDASNKVVSWKGTLKPLADGSAVISAFELHWKSPVGVSYTESFSQSGMSAVPSSLPVPGTLVPETYRWQLFADSATPFGSAPPVNTTSASSHVDVSEYNFELIPSIAISSPPFSLSPVEPVLIPSGTDGIFPPLSPSAPASCTFYCPGGYPHLLAMPGYWRYPFESPASSLIQSYPAFSNWLSSKGVSDKSWYFEPNCLKVYTAPDDFIDLNDVTLSLNPTTGIPSISWTKACSPLVSNQYYILGYQRIETAGGNIYTPLPDFPKYVETSGSMSYTSNRAVNGCVAFKVYHVNSSVSTPVQLAGTLANITSHFHSHVNLSVFNPNGGLGCLNLDLCLAQSIVPGSNQVTDQSCCYGGVTAGSTFSAAVVYDNSDPSSQGTSSVLQTFGTSSSGALGEGSLGLDFTSSPSPYAEPDRGAFVSPTTIGSSAISQPPASQPLRWVAPQQTDAGSDFMIATVFDPNSGDGPIVYGWGDNTYGQIGQGGSTANANSPTQIFAFPNLFRVIDVSAGADHALVLASIVGTAGQVGQILYGFGRNQHGQLCDGTFIDRGPPVTLGIFYPSLNIATGVFQNISGPGGPIPGVTVPLRSVSAGNGITALLDEAGGLYTCGRNADALGRTPSVSEPQELPYEVDRDPAVFQLYREVSVGSETCVAIADTLQHGLTQFSRPYGWGDGSTMAIGMANGRTPMDIDPSLPRIATAQTWEHTMLVEDTSSWPLTTLNVYGINANHRTGDGGVAINDNVMGGSVTVPAGQSWVRAAEGQHMYTVGGGRHAGAISSRASFPDDLDLWMWGSNLNAEVGVGAIRSEEGIEPGDSDYTFERPLYVRNPEKAHCCLGAPYALNSTDPSSSLRLTNPILGEDLGVMGSRLSPAISTVPLNEDEYDVRYWRLTTQLANSAVKLSDTNYAVGQDCNYTAAGRRSSSVYSSAGAPGSILSSVCFNYPYSSSNPLGFDFCTPYNQPQFVNYQIEWFPERSTDDICSGDSYWPLRSQYSVAQVLNEAQNQDFQLSPSLAISSDCAGSVNIIGYKPEQFWVNMEFDVYEFPRTGGPPVESVVLNNPAQYTPDVPDGTYEIEARYSIPDGLGGLQTCGPLPNQSVIQLTRSMSASTGVMAAMSVAAPTFTDDPISNPGSNDRQTEPVIAHATVSGSDYLFAAYSSYRNSGGSPRTDDVIVISSPDHSFSAGSLSIVVEDDSATGESFSTVNDIAMSPDGSSLYIVGVVRHGFPASSACISPQLIENSIVYNPVFPDYWCRGVQDPMLSGTRYSYIARVDLNYSTGSYVLAWQRLIGMSERNFPNADSVIGDSPEVQAFSVAVDASHAYVVGHGDVEALSNYSQPAFDVAPVRGLMAPSDKRISVLSSGISGDAGFIEKIDVSTGYTDSIGLVDSVGNLTDFGDPDPGLYYAEVVNNNLVVIGTSDIAREIHAGGVENMGFGIGSGYLAFDSSVHNFPDIPIPDSHFAAHPEFTFVVNVDKQSLSNSGSSYGTSTYASNWIRFVGASTWRVSNTGLSQMDIVPGGYEIVNNNGNYEVYVAGEARSGNLFADLKSYDHPSYRDMSIMNVVGYDDVWAAGWDLDSGRLVLEPMREGAKHPTECTWTTVTQSSSAADVIRAFRASSGADSTVEDCAVFHSSPQSDSVAFWEAPTSECDRRLYLSTASNAFVGDTAGGFPIGLPDGVEFAVFGLETGVGSSSNISISSGGLLTGSFTSHELLASASSGAGVSFWHSFWSNLGSSPGLLGGPIFADNSEGVFIELNDQ